MIKIRNGALSESHGSEPSPRDDDAWRVSSPIIELFVYTPRDTGAMGDNVQRTRHVRDVIVHILIRRRRRRVVRLTPFIFGAPCT